MPSKNDITGDQMKTKSSNDAYRDGWERIFGNKKQEEPKVKKEAPKKSAPKKKKKISVAFAVGCTEFERGWGQRPDGYLLFETEMDADEFIDKIRRERVLVTFVPDEYINYDKLGYREVAPEILKQVRSSGKLWVSSLSQKA